MAQRTERFDARGLVALAQDKTPVTNEVRAQSFTLGDPSNHTIGKFTVERDGGSTSKRIVLKDSAGHEIWSAGDIGIVR